MEFRFGNLTPSDRDQWDYLSLVGEQSTPFHSFEWEQALRVNFPDETSIYWGIWRNDELIAIWPTSVVPVLGGTVLNPLFVHADYFASAPAIKNGLEMASLREVLSDIAGVVKKRYHALSWSLRIPRSWTFAETAPYCGFEVIPSNITPSIVLDTSVKPEAVWNKCPHGGLRTCVRKAEREGLDVRESSYLCDLNEYFVAKYSEARQPTAEQLRSLSFWAAIHRLFICCRKAKLFVARHEDRIIGGAIVFFQNNKAYLWNMGSMQSTWRMHPTHILLWNMIEWAHNSGIESIDCGNGTNGTHYFVQRNLADYDRVDNVTLKFPISKFRSELQISLETTYKILHAWAPLRFTNWYCRSVAGIT